MTTPQDEDSPVAIVTGAGSGIGRETARMLADRGHRLVLVGRRLDRLEETRAGLAAPERHRSIAADLADSGLAHGVVDTTLAALGRLDALVLCAGTAPLKPIDQTDEDVLEEAFLVNTFGPAFLISRAWPHFKSRRAGRIVLVSTIGTSDPFPGFFAYAAAKSACDSFARSIRAEGARLGIRGFAVNPGAVETEMLRRNFPESMLPASKALSPEAVASVIVACACGERDEDNGRAIAVPSP